MGTYRKRFNEKARAGHMARLKELKRIRNKQFHRDDLEDESVQDEEVSNQDSNSSILKPMTESEKQEKKRKLEDLFTPKESKVSRQKKKRLDKFIEHQLKREEKKVLINKLQDYKIDTSLMTSSKNLGHGRQTKKEEFAEALSLEKQGRGNATTDEILYEEHTTKPWDKEQPIKTFGNENSEDSDSEGDDFQDKFGAIPETNKSSFIDHRPVKLGGQGGFGFGFSNIKVVTKEEKVNSTIPKKKYNWRQRVELQEKRQIDEDDAHDFDSSSGDDDEEDNVDEEDDDDEEVETGDSSGEQNSSGSEMDTDMQDGSDSDDDETESIPKDKSAVAEEFKTWANQSIRTMEGRDIEIVTPTLSVEYQPIVRQEDLDDGLPTSNVPVDETSNRKAFYVKIERPEEIQASRIQLPAYGEEHNIMEAIHHNDVIIISGETGSGKTTQVPQFLYESGFGNEKSPDYPGMIGITQPRRVAAVSMANRVANELGDHGKFVAYQIRFDSSTKNDTKVKFMTDGVLLREMMVDFKLTKYSSIIIDEAHERNTNTDILIGMLSRCVRLRAKEHTQNPETHKRLKLIIMSATLRVADFSENTNLFATPPPVLNVTARQFPVSVHFNRRTPFNYTDEAFKKTCKIHSRLPPGAILIFLTGQQEITQMVKKLRKEFPFKNKKVNVNNEVSKIKIDSRNADMEAEDIDFSVKIIDEEKFKEEIGSENEKSDDESDEEEGFEETLEEGQTESDPLYVLPLYSLLPTNEQMKVFEDPPAGSRLCVVATNVAETSLTIPGVRYVVDCGRSKERKYNAETGVQSFEIDWVSKASAGQRSGRAGRTGPGHCYRLYSSAVFERDFGQFSSPEILRTPVENVVLQMKSMAIHNITNFPFPTPPERHALSTALELLRYLGALDEKEKITSDGRRMSLFPLSARFSKMLLTSNEHDCLPYVVSIVSALSVGDPFISETELGIGAIPIKKTDAEEENDDDSEDDAASQQERTNLRAKFRKNRKAFDKLDKYSDIFRTLSVVCAYDYIKRPDRVPFVRNNFLRGKLMDEIVKLRKQLMYIIKSNISEENIAVSVRDSDLLVPVPSDIQIKLLKQMVCSGFPDRVAIRADALFQEDAKITNRTNIINIPYIPVLTKKLPQIEECFSYIHPTSILTNSGEVPPLYLVFSSLHKNNNGKTRMSTLCDIKSTALANIARKGSLLSYSKPLTGNGLKSINISPTERYCYVVPRFGSSIDSDIKIGWELNPIPVHQKKINGKWMVEKFITNKNYKTLEQKQKA
ncbi:similar to Saccharomyces cerevisiae YMR128W ECM16 Essential DEAH-box ATP-dependent RNA helicase specific to the U3 snoRNP, predominantly nucleolar in distribution, required for 18S rRNA synthesis [Maudiozyma barnettii]|uniref:RNA helicase n=1 Tax=Maudiozyma barnettii TaxID=61262 RepID=A0A8H2ZJJ9_9SACH|nr:ATP-dependent RNA helicase ECM16 [Kazachstania barnettii]CAB4257108.1 similar to Saccharomyces cerevisiae YMR128W ECM16 Essential DEAH-box ATP-dependent RNA helicase specific to the U3 snoRNP, predominantly nucleolar in distribution, required for 18S rRNA synthesis [Kazachstania barnettii]CAD1779478.1 similar to Saccharomyces cerevisiae YMR128W ECM16 Essential DEAH-box ATP-dependent RNA helicase specific to the U3 snoRNP, predominantly nucleolar in distribution, required for 18S rRNA synthesis